MADPDPALLTGPLELHGRIMPASNATFLGEIEGTRVVYKPEAGERPLWDFPDGTLAHRERAAYLVAEALGWDVVPLTFLRDGPHGELTIRHAGEPLLITTREPTQVAVKPLEPLLPAPQQPPGREPIRRHRTPPHI